MSELGQMQVGISRVADISRGYTGNMDLDEDLCALAHFARKAVRTDFVGKEFWQAVDDAVRHLPKPAAVKKARGNIGNGQSANTDKPTETAVTASEAVLTWEKARLAHDRAEWDETTDEKEMGRRYSRMMALRELAATTQCRSLDDVRAMLRLLLHEIMELDSGREWRAAVVKNMLAYINEEPDAWALAGEEESGDEASARDEPTV